MAKHVLGVGRILIFMVTMAASSAMALEPRLGRAMPGLEATAGVRVLFSGQHDVAGEIVHSIGLARRQVLVQAFSFTHPGIARALIEAHRRGVEVKLIADREQTEKMTRGQVPGIAAAGVPVWLDDAHQSAHNKVMVIDAGMPDAIVITGSFNFTKAAQYKNAENVLMLGSSPSLSDAYARNWQAHLVHSQPFRIH